MIDEENLDTPILPVTPALDGTPHLRSEMLSDPKNLLPWEYTSKCDLFRRFALSLSKSSAICIFFILNLETFSLIRTRELNDFPYPIIMLLSMSGALIEPLLSCFPQANRNGLAVWNGVYQTFENLLLKFFTFSIFFCGFVEVSGVKHRFLPESNCIQSNQALILGLVILLSPGSVLSGYFEYTKYTRLKNLDENQQTAVTKKYKCLDPNHYASKVINAAFDVSFSSISLLSTMSTILKLRTSHDIPVAAELSVAAVLALIAGTLVYRRNDSKKVNKSIYFYSEFARPSLGNYYASIYLIFTIIPYIGNIDVAKMSKEVQLTLLAVAYLMVVVFNLLRAIDATWYKFAFQQIERVSNPLRAIGNGSVQEPKEDDDYCSWRVAEFCSRVATTFRL